MSHRSSFFAVSLSLCLNLCPLRGALRAEAQPVTPPAAPTEAAVILSIRGDRATINVGSARGAQIGAVYGVLRDGQVRVSLRIVEVQDDRSFAQILGQDPSARFAVGDAVQFIANPNTTAGAPGTTAGAPGTTAGAPGTDLASPETAAGVPETVGQALPIASARTLSALVTAVEGANITLNIGALQGLSLNRNLPLLRGGEAIGMVRVQSVTPNASQARVIWRDENIAAALVGDSVEIPPGALTGRNPIIIARGETPPAPAIPVAPATSNSASDDGFRPLEGSQPPTATPHNATLRFESGASNLGVPRAEFTYEMLAALAASGVITRYPASLFADEGVRFHRTAEDLTLTRAQIAALLREAMQNQSATEFSGRDRLFLGELARQFAPELRQLGVETPTLAAFAPQKGFRLGVSGQQRLSFVGGDKDNLFVPFSERQGGLRTRSGFDTRLNLLGRMGNRASFIATLDAGSKPGARQNGLGDSANQGLQVRRALFSYDASGASRKLHGLTLEAGRNEVWLGPGHFGTLLLGDTAGPLNQVGYRFQRGALTVRGLYAPLDNGPNRTGQRSLYIRDSRYQIGSQAAIGFSESVFVPRDRFDPALFATVFSPIPLFITQRRGKNDASEKSNLLQSFYAEAGVARGLRTYGELLIDDIGVNNENLALNRIGTLLGVHVFTPRDPAKLGAYGEFARLAGRTYLRFGNFDPDYDYYYRSRPLGYPVAPTQIPGIFSLPSLGGAESLRFEGYYRPTPKLNLTAGFEFADLNSERPDLSRQQTLRFSASYNFSPALSLSARAMQVQTSQPNFIPGEAALRQRLLQIELSRAF